MTFAQTCWKPFTAARRPWRRTLRWCACFGAPLLSLGFERCRLGVARPLSRCRGIRELSRLRLRICPFAELSGLGTMARENQEAAEMIWEAWRHARHADFGGFPRDSP